MLQEVRTETPFPGLFQPGTIGTLHLKNRIVMPPMGTVLSDSGFVSSRLIDYYEARAKGGVALIIVEISCVDAPLGLAVANQLRIDDDRFVSGLAELAKSIRKHNVRAAVQLHHAGHATRIAVAGQQPVGPSCVARPGFDQPRELTVEEIRRLVERFADAAKRAVRAGFDGVELNAAHLFLFGQFLSTAWNKRQDEYGGTLINRARFAVETMKAIRQTIGRSYPAWCRISGVEDSPGGGITPEEAQQVARLMEEAGADAINVSSWADSGPYANRVPMSEPGGNLIPLAERMKRAVSVPVIAVGKIAPDIGERALREGKADFIAIGRALIADPELPLKAASGRMAEIRPCLACNRCVEYAIVNEHKLRCSVNAAVGHEAEFTIRPAARKLKVLIIGGGPAGMEAARIACLRGHTVSLLEKNAQLGGQMLLAALPPHKEIIRSFTNYLTGQLNHLPVDIELGRTATPTDIGRLSPEVLILATGVVPVVPDIPGIHEGVVAAAGDVLSGKVSVGERVLVIGGELVGCETAEFLANRGKKVTVLRRGRLLATNEVRSVRERLLARLDSLGVATFTGVTYHEISKGGLRLTTADGNSRTILADSIVLAAGSRPNTELLEAFRGKAPIIHLIGDCVRPRNIMEAVADGHRIAFSLS